MLSGVYFKTAHLIKSLINTKYRSCGIIIRNNRKQDCGGTRTTVGRLFGK